MLDVIAAIRNEPSYVKNRNYWKYLKAKLKQENSQLVSVTTQLKFTAPDGKKRLSDALNADGIILLAAEFPARIQINNLYNDVHSWLYEATTIYCKQKLVW